MKFLTNCLTMHQARLGLFALSFFLASASGQVTGTYPVSVTSSGPPGTAGTVLSNYPQCAVSMYHRQLTNC